MDAAPVQELLEKHTTEVNQLLSEDLGEAKLKACLLLYKCQAVAVAQFIDLVNPEIQKWIPESDQSAVSRMNEKLISLPKDRDTKRALKDFLELIITSVEKFDRLCKRKTDDAANTGEGQGVLGRFLSGSMFRFFRTGSDSKHEQVNDTGSSGQLNFVNKSNMEIEEETDIDGASRFRREVQSDTAHHKKSDVDGIQDSKARSESNIAETTFSDGQLEPQRIEKSSVPQVLDETYNVGNRNEPVAQTPTATGFLQPGLPAIRLISTLSPKNFSSNDSCQFLPGGKEGCTRHDHTKYSLKRTKSEHLTHRADDQKSTSSIQSHFEGPDKAKSWSQIPTSGFQSEKKPKPRNMVNGNLPFFNGKECKRPDSDETLNQAETLAEDNWHNAFSDSTDDQLQDGTWRGTPQDCKPPSSGSSEDGWYDAFARPKEQEPQCNISSAQASSLKEQDNPCLTVDLQEKSANKEQQNACSGIITEADWKEAAAKQWGDRYPGHLTSDSSQDLLFKSTEQKTSTTLNDMTSGEHGWYGINDMPHGKASHSRASSKKQEKSAVSKEGAQMSKDSSGGGAKSNCSKPAEQRPPSISSSDGAWCDAFPEQQHTPSLGRPDAQKYLNNVQETLKEPKYPCSDNGKDGQQAPSTDCDQPSPSNTISSEGGWHNEFDDLQQYVPPFKTEKTKHSSSDFAYGLEEPQFSSNGKSKNGQQESFAIPADHNTPIASISRANDRHAWADDHQLSQSPPNGQVISRNSYDIYTESNIPKYSNSEDIDNCHPAPFTKPSERESSSTVNSGCGWQDAFDDHQQYSPPVKDQKAKKELYNFCQTSENAAYPCGGNSENDQQMLTTEPTESGFPLTIGNEGRWHDTFDCRQQTPPPLRGQMADKKSYGGYNTSNLGQYPNNDNSESHQQEDIEAAECKSSILSDGEWRNAFFEPPPYSAQNTEENFPVLPTSAKGFKHPCNENTKNDQPKSNTKSVECSSTKNSSRKSGWLNDFNDHQWVSSSISEQRFTESCQGGSLASKEHKYPCSDVSVDDRRMADIKSTKHGSSNSLSNKGDRGAISDDPKHFALPYSDQNATQKSHELFSTSKYHECTSSKRNDNDWQSSITQATDHQPSGSVRGRGHLQEAKYYQHYTPPCSESHAVDRSHDVFATSKEYKYPCSDISQQEKFEGDSNWFDMVHKQQTPKNLITENVLKDHFGKNLPWSENSYPCGADIADSDELNMLKAIDCEPSACSTGGEQDASIDSWQGTDAVPKDHVYMCSEGNEDWQQTPHYKTDTQLSETFCGDKFSHSQVETNPCQWSEGTADVGRSWDADQVTVPDRFSLPEQPMYSYSEDNENAQKYSLSMPPGYQEKTSRINTESDWAEAWGQCQSSKNGENGMDEMETDSIEQKMPCFEAGNKDVSCAKKKTSVGHLGDQIVKKAEECPPLAFTDPPKQKLKSCLKNSSQHFTPGGQHQCKSYNGSESACESYPDINDGVFFEKTSTDSINLSSFSQIESIESGYTSTEPKDKIPQPLYEQVIDAKNLKSLKSTEEPSGTLALDSTQSNMKPCGIENEDLFKDNVHKKCVTSNESFDSARQSSITSGGTSLPVIERSPISGVGSDNHVDINTSDLHSFNDQCFQQTPPSACQSTEQNPKNLGVKEPIPKAMTDSAKCASLSNHEEPAENEVVEKDKSTSSADGQLDPFWDNMDSNFQRHPGCCCGVDCKCESSLSFSQKEVFETVSADVDLGLSERSHPRSSFQPLVGRPELKAIEYGKAEVVENYGTNMKAYNHLICEPPPSDATESVEIDKAGDNSHKASPCDTNPIPTQRRPKEGVTRCQELARPQNNYSSGSETSTSKTGSVMHSGPAVIDKSLVRAGEKLQSKSRPRSIICRNSAEWDKMDDFLPAIRQHVPEKKKVSAPKENPRVGVSTGVRVEYGLQELEILERSLHERFTKTDRYINDKDYISTDGMVTGDCAAVVVPSSEPVDYSVRTSRPVDRTASEVSNSEKTVDVGEGMNMRSEINSDSSSRQVTALTSSPPITVKRVCSYDDDTISSLTQSDVNREAYVDNNKDAQIGMLECEIKKLQGEVDVSALYSEKLLNESQRLKSKYDAEAEAKAIISGKLERSEAKVERLKTALQKSQNSLSAAEMELSVLQDTEQMSHRFGSEHLEAELEEAIRERKTTLEQLKSAEKLLEEVITEKDDLTTSNSEMRGVVSRLRRENEKMVQKVTDLEKSYKDASERERTLEEQLSELREKLLQYQKKHNQIQKQKENTLACYDDMKTSKQDLEERNTELEKEVSELKTRLIKFDSKVLKWEDEVAKVHESQTEELDNWRELVRQSNVETHQTKAALKALQNDHDESMKVWSLEKSELQSQIHEGECDLEKARSMIAELQQQNDGMSIAITERLPLELEETKCALQTSKQEVDKLTEDNIQLLSALNESSPTSELLAEKKIVETLKNDIEELKTLQTAMTQAVRENLQEELDKSNAIIRKSQEKIKELQSENAKLSKLVNESHPAEIGKLMGQLTAANQCIKSLREQNADLMYTICEQSCKVQEVSTSSTNSIEQRKEVCKLLRAVTECNKLNDQTVDCADCRRKGSAIARLCHDMCVYIEKERKKSKQHNDQHSEWTSSQISTKELEQCQGDPLKGVASSDTTGECKQCQLLQAEIDFLKHLLRDRIKENVPEDVLLASGVLQEQISTLQKDLQELREQNKFLKEELEATREKFEVDVQNQLKEVTSKHSKAIEKAGLSIRLSKVKLAKTKSARDSAKSRSTKGSVVAPKATASAMASTTAGVETAAAEEAAALLTAGAETAPDVVTETALVVSTANTARAGAETTAVVVRRASTGPAEKVSKEMANSAADEKDEDTAKPNARDITRAARKAVERTLEKKIRLIEELTEQNDALSEDMEAMVLSLEKLRGGKAEETSALQEMKRKMSQQSTELNILSRRLETTQKELNSCSRKESSDPSVAYIVRKREDEIRELKSEVAELQRSLAAQTRIIPCETALAMKKRSRTSTGRLSKVDMIDGAVAGSNKSLVVAILTEETQKLKDLSERLREENKRLHEALREKDMALVELKSTLKRYETVLKTQSETGKRALQTYPKKLKEGESELSRLHVQLDMMSQRPSSFEWERENETLTVKSDYAQQLSKMIDDCTGQSGCKEKEMRELCDKLDAVEALNFEYAEQIKELSHLKSYLIPKLKAEVEEARLQFDETKAELGKTTKALREADLKNTMLTIEKDEALEKLRMDLSKLCREKDGGLEELGIIQKQSKAMMEARENELVRLRASLMETQATAQEKEGSAIHWKLQHDNKALELKDMEEKIELTLKAKDQELTGLRESYNDMQKGKIMTKSEREKQVAYVNKQLKSIQNKHLEVIHRTKSSEKISGESITKLYTEIGDLNVSLQNDARQSSEEVERLQKEVDRVHKEKKAFQEECAKMIQNKQIEIRRLTSEIAKMEIEAAKLNASRENEMNQLRDELKQKIDKANTEKAHLNASQSNELTRLRAENEKLAAILKRDTKIQTELREQVKKIELDKSDLSVRRTSLQTENEKIKKELERCKHDKKYFERMVERLNSEMESRITSMKQDSTRALLVKDERTNELYNKLEKIARERGDLSTELHTMLQNRDAKIEELSLKVDEMASVMEKAEIDYKMKLDKKSKEVKNLRTEIKKMGTEGMRLLEQREKEILEMRGHLRNVLKVMENRAKLSKDSIASLDAGKTLKQAKSVSTAGITHNLMPNRSQRFSITSKPSRKTVMGKK